MDIDESLIRRFSGSLNKHFPVLHVVLNEDNRGDTLREFCDLISGVIPKIRMDTRKDENTQLPYIQVLPNLRYHAVPDGKNLAGFLEALKFQNGSVPDLDGKLSKKLKDVEIPAMVDIYIASQCPYCPTTVSRMVPLAAANELVRVSIIDGEVFQEKAESSGVRSVPTITLDDMMSWTGSTKLEEIVERMVDRDPAQLSTEALKGMIQEGNAGQVAQLMLDTDSVFPGFVQLLCDTSWSVRLGAMVAMENLATLDNRLAERAASLLWENFSRAKDALKGDMLYIIGEAGARNLLSEIKSVIDGNYNAEVKEAAKEAIAALSN